MITFSLIRRDLPNGHVAIVLYLFRKDDVASVTTIATVAPNLATQIFMKARVHLRKSGVRDASEPLLAAG